MQRSSPPRIIGVCGKIGSGKSTFVSELLRQIPKAERIGTGDILKSELLPKDSILNRSELLNAVQSKRNGLGPDFVKNAIRTRIEESGSEFIVIDGVRGPNVKNLMDEYPDSVLILIVADSDHRYKRIRTRDEKLDEIGIERNVFEKNDQNDHPAALSALESEADVRIENNGSYEEFMSEIQKFIETMAK